MRDSTTGRYQHFSAHGVDPEMGARGAGASTEKHGLPELLLQEMLSQMLGQCSKKELQGKRVVINLCAGDQSWRPVIEQRGLRYIGIDLRAATAKWRC